MVTQNLQLIEVPPFDFYLVAGKSPRTFGLKEFFSQPKYTLEIVVSQEEKAKLLETIIHQEVQRSTLDVLLQGFAGASAGTGVVATASAAGSTAGMCSVACSPLLYIALTPGAGVAAALAVLPAGYALIKRFGQRKSMQSLENSLQDARVKTLNYEPILHASSFAGLRERVSQVETYRREVKKRPREEGRVHVELLTLSGLSSRLFQETGEESYQRLARTYAFLAGRYGEQTEKEKPFFLQPVQYAPVSKKSLVVAALGGVMLITGGALWLAGVNPLEYFFGNE